MKCLGLAILILTGALMGAAEAGSYGSYDSSGCKDKDALNHNAQDPTQPGTIGGCGTGQYKLDQFEKDQKTLQNQQILTGPKRTGSGENL